MKKVIDVNQNILRKVPLIAIGIVIIFIAVFVGFGFFTVIEEGEVGLVNLFGKVSDDPLEAGFRLKNPFSKIVKMDIKTQEYTMSAALSEGQKEGDDSIEVLTNEGLSLNMDVTILFKLDPQKASSVYKEIGVDYKDKIIRPIIRNTIREVSSQYTAQELYSTKRTEIVNALNDQVQNRLSEKGVITENVLLRDIKLPTQLKTAIESKQAAEQEAEKMKFVLDKEKQEAERKRVESEGIRDAQDIISQKLSPEYLRWYSIDMMKELAESENSTYVFVPTDSNGMPIVNLNPSK